MGIKCIELDEGPQQRPVIRATQTRQGCPCSQKSRKDWDPTPYIHPQGPQLCLPASHLPYLVLGRAGGKQHLAGIEELRVGIREGQDAALRQLGRQLSPLHVQSFLLWEQDGGQPGRERQAGLPSPASSPRRQA